jgi:hypothetical protein
MYGVNNHYLAVPKSKPIIDFCNISFSLPNEDTRYVIGVKLKWVIHVTLWGNPRCGTRVFIENNYPPFPHKKAPSSIYSWTPLSKCIYVLGRTVISYFQYGIIFWDFLLFRCWWDKEYNLLIEYGSRMHPITLFFHFLTPPNGLTTSSFHW